MRAKPFLNLARACLAALALFIIPATSLARPEQRQAATAQTTQPKAAPKEDEKAAEVVRHAVEALGGGAYLGVKTLVSRGHFTPFKDGVATLPTAFTDYLILPDRDRTEFRGAGVKTIQTYTGDTGWIADLLSKKILELKPEQVEDFHTSVRTSVDNLLRGWWRGEGASLAYVGRREAGLARRNEVVRLTYPDGFEAEFEFDSKEWLPSKVKYKKGNSEGERVEEEDRFAQLVSVGAVRFPFVVDHFTAGVQASRVNYDSVEFNRPVPDSLFTKPADVKAVKLTQ
ncbi:MAG: hypothetical protein M3348_00300 [Acidobacteriota bacterium]|nr:hypothetical protein [Acidobacteriota bacterium]